MTRWIGSLHSDRDVHIRTPNSKTNSNAPSGAFLLDRRQFRAVYRSPIDLGVELSRYSTRMTDVEYHTSITTCERQ